MLLKIDEKDK